MPKVRRNYCRLVFLRFTRFTRPRVQVTPNVDGIQLSEDTVTL